MNRSTMRIAKHLLNQWPDAHHWLSRKWIVICYGQRVCSDRDDSNCSDKFGQLGNKMENRWECGCSIVDNIVDIDTKSTNSGPRVPVCRSAYRVNARVAFCQFDFNTHRPLPSSPLNLIDSDGYTRPATHRACSHRTLECMDTQPGFVVSTMNDLFNHRHSGTAYAERITNVYLRVYRTNAAGPHCLRLLSRHALWNRLMIYWWSRFDRTNRLTAMHSSFCKWISRTWTKCSQRNLHFAAEQW